MSAVAAGKPTRRAARRLVLAVLFAGLGFVCAKLSALRWPAVMHMATLTHSRAYDYGITALLAMGLFASAFGISRRELLRNSGLVIVAVTFGVVLKALLTGGLMLLVFRHSAYLMLGVAVAQIDPLAVAAMINDSPMSSRAKSVLSAWASFDDPVTVLLTIYFAVFALGVSGSAGSTHILAAKGSLSFYGLQLGLNLLLAAVAFAAWCVLRWVKRRWAAGAAVDGFAVALLLGLVVAAVRYDLLLGLTISALFFRPPIGRFLEQVVRIAFYAAVFLLGTLLTGNGNLLAGILLGLSAFGVQVLAGYVIGCRMTRADRGYLALGQQNGITAIILALALQPYFPAAVGIIAIAILTVNVIHVIGNQLWTAHVAAMPARLTLSAPVARSASPPMNQQPGRAPDVSAARSGGLPAARPTADPSHGLPSASHL